MRRGSAIFEEGFSFLIALTFDWNCIIAFENKEKEDEKQAKYVELLLEAHCQGKLDVAVTAVSAAENLRGYDTEENRFGSYVQRLSKVGLSSEKAVLAPAVFDRSFIGHSFIQSHSDVELYEKIRDIVSPKLKDPSSLSERNRTNKFCDASTLHAHIISGRDVFVTADGDDFQKKAVRLKELVSVEVLSPEQAVAKYLAATA